MTDARGAATEVAEDPSAALESANPAVLLAVLVTLTGRSDRARVFLDELSYGYERGGILASLPPQRMAALVSWAVEVLADLGAEQAGLDLTDEQFAELASGLVGWPVPVESAEYFKEQAGFVDFVAATAHPDVDLVDASLVVVGAGMAGIAAAVACRKAGISCTVLEKADSVGGVWRQNTYPGVGVDTPSAYYSFSFEVNDGWSGIYPSGEEYLAYLNRVADRYDVRRDMVFGAEVAALRWDEPSGRWQVSYRRGGTTSVVEARAVMTAAGYLTSPQLPDVPGLDRFAGTWFHSAEWNHDYDFTDKRLAVVGTGCTSVQVVDALADEVASLTLVQRQPHWVMPAAVEEKFTPAEIWLNANVPTYATWARLLTYLPISDANYPVVRYDEEWARTHDLSISQANDQVLQLADSHLREVFADRPDLLGRMRPDFAPFGKRPIRDPGNYYRVLKRDTSQVVSGLSEVVPEGFVDADGTLHEVDVIVYATGFRLEYLAGVDIAGRDGLRLAEVWGDSPVAYNGCLVPGFPNLFITSGPNASAAHGGGHNFTVEAVVHYVIESIRATEAKGARYVEATAEALSRWKEEVDRLMTDSIWQRERRATTYYRNSSGEVILASPLEMEDYWNRLRGPDPHDVVFGT